MRERGRPPRAPLQDQYGFGVAILGTMIRRAVGLPMLWLLSVGCGPRQPLANSSPRVSRAEAESIATARMAGGTTLDSALEGDRGRLVWWFDIAVSGRRDRTEIEVDATNGKIVAMMMVQPPDEPDPTPGRR